MNWIPIANNNVVQQMNLNMQQLNKAHSTSGAIVFVVLAIIFTNLLVWLFWNMKRR